MSLLVKTGGIWRTAVSTKIKRDGAWLFATVDAKKNGVWENAGSGLGYTVGTDQISPGVFGMQSNFGGITGSYLQMIGSCVPYVIYVPPTHIGPIFYQNWYIHEIYSDNNAGTTRLSVRPHNIGTYDYPYGTPNKYPNAIFNSFTVQTVTFQAITLNPFDAAITYRTDPFGIPPDEWDWIWEFTWPTYIGWEGNGVRKMGFDW